MSVEIVSLIFGCILLLIGIVGGGFELKEFKVPKVSWAPRAMAGVAGVVFILIGISMYAMKSLQAAEVEKSNLLHEREAPARPTQPTAPAPSAEPAAYAEPRTPAPAEARQIDFTIRDGLGEQQLSEQIVVLINGRTVGTLTVNSQYPSSMLKVTVPRAGQYSYTVSGRAVFDVDGTAFEYSGAGQGTIDVEKGKSFDLVGGISGNTWTMALREAE